MKIVRVEATPFRIPLKKATAWARGVIDAAEHVLVRVHTDEGIAGVAEAPPRPTIYGESIQSIQYCIDHWLGPMMVGLDAFETEKMWDRFDTIAGNPTAKAALDMALWDIMGKAVNLPCYKLLGGWTDRVQLSWCVNLNPVGEMVEEAHEMIRAYGFRCLKLKTGIDPRKDLEMLKVMRSELGDEIMIYIDANQGYDPFSAVEIIKRMGEYNIAFVEEPCPVWDSKGRQRVSQRIDIPMMGDESCLTPADVARQIDLDCLRIISIKTARTGFTQSRKIIHLCEQAAIRNLHGLQGDTSVGSLSSAHLCAAMKNTAAYYPSEISFFLMLTDDFLKEPIAIKDGFLVLPDKPGLGIEVDWKAFERVIMS